MTKSIPLVSVVITTKNEERHIANCIKSIKAQSYKNIEVILVDNSSTDNTKKIAKSLGAKIFNKGPERSSQRNYGITQGKGKYAMYIDADMILSKNIISECVKLSESNDSLTGLYIPEVIVGNGFWIKVRSFERSFYTGTVVDCVRFFSKSAFKKVKGFDLSMTGPEDWDFDKKIRSIGEVKVIKSPIYHNEGSFNLKSYLAKKSYYSKSMNTYAKKWGKNSKEVRQQLGAYYRLIGIFIADKKFLKILAHPILTISMYYLRFRVAIRYLTR